MPDFSKGSTFNKDANFQGVKFGADAPLLETELNELQDIQTEARADIIRDSIPSGFTQLGELDFDYMFNNENCVKLKTDSVAYVNGYKINIPKGTVINIGKAPEKDAREDLLFLEVWKEEVTKDSSLTVAGGEGQASTSNNILDSRVGQETSRRVALKWRIRHVANVDFNTYNEGFGYKTILGVGYNFSVTPQGGNNECLTLPPILSLSAELYKCLLSYEDRVRANILPNNINDRGLYISGKGDSTSKTLLKTLDGYVYAIPMFRLYRKPSCGKAIPFEYQKINPKVDYSKFTELMKEERVERVISENIQGQSLVNLYLENPKRSDYFSIGTKIIINNDNTFTTTCDTSSGYHNLQVGKDKLALKPSTTYTVIFEVLSTSFSTGTFSIGATHPSVSTKFKSEKVFQIKNVGVFTGTLQTKDSFVDVTLDSRDFFLLPTNEVNGKLVFNYMILEGDWTNKPLPKFFTGLKSVGEEESLITVKNSILNESSYDPSTGTPKLNTVSGANYISSDNLIMPNIEGQVKRGEEKVSDLTTFGKVGSLVGDEKVEFTKIKGRTLQNLANIKYLGSSEIKATNVTNGIKITNTTEGSMVIGTDSKLLKSNTNYTLMFTLDHNLSAFSGLVNSDSYESVTSVAKGFNRLLVTTKDTKHGFVMGYVGSLPKDSYIQLTNFIVLEGDYTNTPLDQLPYIEGIKSVGENEDNKLILQNRGSNLLTDNNWYPVLSISGDQIKIKPDKMTSYTMAKYGTIFTELEPGDYVLSSEDFLYLNRQSLNGKIIGLVSIPLPYKFTVVDSKQLVGFSFERSANATDPTDIAFGNNLPRDFKIKIEKGNIATKDTLQLQEITLKEPLRSLPNGVCDTIEGNKVIRRVGKLFLNGTENWVKNPNGFTNTSDFYISVPNKNKHNFMCSNLPLIIGDDIQGLATHINSVEYSSNAICIRILKTNLSTNDVQGFKTWLSQNPTTVYYELANPVEELIEPNYDKESIKTYQLDQPLRSLPNGVKDEIVGNKLIRRCGEYTITGNETWSISFGGWENKSNIMTVENFKLPNAPSKTDINLMADKLPTHYFNHLWSSSEGIEGIGYHINGGIVICLNKTKLSENTLTSFKTWLKANPVKVIYELATPIEIPLKEVLPSEVNFSLARQFNYTDNYLLELPNGVKDTVENGKVTRRVGKAIINETGTYERSNNSDSKTLTSHFNIKGITDMKPLSQGIMSDYFRTTPTLPLANCDNIEGIIISDTNIWLNINKSRLTSDDVTGLKAWLSNNPITILYELATPTTEELSGNNNRYCPYHIEDNTYCGSMYLGNGTNDTITDTVIKSEEVIIDTPFRESTGKLVVNDCKYKKNSDGYDKPINANLLDVSIFEKGTLIATTGEDDNAPDKLEIRCRSLYIELKPGTYTLSKNINEWFCIVGYDSNKTFVKTIADESSNGATFTLTSNIKYIRIRFNCALQDILTIKPKLEIGEKASMYIPFEDRWGRYLENTERNDIEDLRHQVSLTGFNYEQVLNESFDLLLRGML